LILPFFDPSTTSLTLFVKCKIIILRNQDINHCFPLCHLKQSLHVHFCFPQTESSTQLWNKMATERQHYQRSAGADGWTESLSGPATQTLAFDSGNLAHEHIAQSGLLLHKTGKRGIIQLDQISVFENNHVRTGRKHVKELDLAKQGLAREEWPRLSSCLTSA
jgi:hypothetical protein